MKFSKSPQNSFPPSFLRQKRPPGSDDCLSRSADFSFIQYLRGGFAYWEG